jgi:hypothetical protein
MEAGQDWRLQAGLPRVLSPVASGASDANRWD